MNNDELSIGNIVRYKDIDIKIIDILDGAYYILENSNYDGKYVFNPNLYIIAKQKLQNCNAKESFVSELENTYFTECLKANNELYKRIHELSNLYLYGKQF